MSMLTAGPAPTSFWLVRNTSYSYTRDAAWHGASLATIFEHSTSAHVSRRAARIDPSSIFAAGCDTADAAS